jgi:hypothetical protein
MRVFLTMDLVPQAQRQKRFRERRQRGYVKVKVGRNGVTAPGR